MTYQPAIAAGFLGLLCLNKRRPILLRNLFIIYTYCIYNVAPLVMGAADTDCAAWSTEYALVLAMFMGGYWIGKRRAARDDGYRLSYTDSSTRLLEQLFILGLTVSFIALAGQILADGPRAWFSGSFLSEKPQLPGQADAARAIGEIIGVVFSLATTAVLCVLFERRADSALAAQPSRARHGRFPMRLFAITWLIAFPFFALQRGAMAFGSIVYLAAESSAPRGSRRSLAPIVLVVIAFVFGVAILKLRNPEVRSDAVETTGLALGSELGAWVGYKEIKDNIGDLHYQYGYRLFVPFVLHLVPRGLAPDKPLGSALYVDKQLHQRRFLVGYGRAFTYLGDLYLNFGLAGVFLGTGLMGAFSGATDTIVLNGRSERLGLFLIVLYNYYILLRVDLSSSVFMMGLLLMLYMFARRLRVGRGRLGIAKATPCVA